MKKTLISLAILIILSNVVFVIEKKISAVKLNTLQQKNTTLKDYLSSLTKKYDTIKRIYKIYSEAEFEYRKIKSEQNLKNNTSIENWEFYTKYDSPNIPYEFALNDHGCIGKIIISNIEIWSISKDEKKNKQIINDSIMVIGNCTYNFNCVENNKKEEYLFHSYSYPNHMTTYYSTKVDRSKILIHAVATELLDEKGKYLRIDFSEHNSKVFFGMMYIR